MLIKRSLWTYIQLHFLFSFLFALPLALGLGLYFSTDSNAATVQVGLIFSCVAGSLIGVVQLVFAGIYLFGPHDVLRIEAGIISVYVWGKLRSFKTEEVVRWARHSAYGTNTITFVLYDGRHISADPIKKLTPEQEQRLSINLGFPEGVNRQVKIEVKNVAEWIVKKDLGRWPFFLGALGILLSIFTAWAFVGFFLGSSAGSTEGSDLVRYNPFLGTLGSLSALLWFIDWGFYFWLLAQKKVRAIFQKEAVVFSSHGKEIRLPYSAIRSIKGDQDTFGDYSGFSLPSLYLKTDSETYRIRFVKISQESEDQIRHFCGLSCYGQ